MSEQKYVFDESNKKKESAIGGIGKFIWNSETKEFLGRDGASWGKVSLFYAVFYLCLGSFFVGMLAVFVQIMPTDKPTYYGESSTMSARGVNPGLGFRPQIDPEDSVILFSPKTKEGDTGFGKYVKNLENFLEAKYKKQEDDGKLLTCVDGTKYEEELKNGKSCLFDHEAIFKATECTKENEFGYKTNRPCVLVKLNKIISWLPSPSNNSDSVRVTCEGETSVDKDNIKKAEYHSENNLHNSNGIYYNVKYFPFFGQKNYRAPFGYVQFDITPNVLVNVECKAYADNIENNDRLNRRGLTKFTLFMSTK